MKSFSLIIISLAFLIGCEDKVSVKWDLGNDRTIDSLKSVIAQKDSTFNGMKADYKSWVIHTFATEDQCLSDAKTIKKNPATSTFAVNWATRNFQWAHSWKKKKPTH